MTSTLVICVWNDICRQGQADPVVWELAGPKEHIVDALATASNCPAASGNSLKHSNIEAAVTVTAVSTLYKYTESSNHGYKFEASSS